jgi:superfamily II DNA or RNA helicase
MDRWKLARWNAGATRQIVNLPTGTGKTPTAAMIIRDFRRKTLFLAHRDELLNQAVEKIGLVIPSPDVGIFKAKERDGLNREICVASVQTAARHTDLLKNKDFKLCVCDECHHATADSYVKVFDELGFMDGDPEKLLIGFTATAFRGDGGALGDVFEEITFERSILAMIKAGYLCDVQGVKIQTGTDLGGVRTRLGDFLAGDLSEAIDTPERNQLIADAYIEHARDRKAIVFCVDVQHAQNVAETLRNNGIPCKAVYGEMGSDERRKTLADFNSGDIRALANCNLLTEGWDSPDLGAVLMARPTKSRVLYIQCVGRGLRTAPGKEDCLLLDFVDISDKHNICSFGTLAGDENLKPRKGQSLLQAVEEKADKQERRYAGTSHAPEHTSEAFSLFDRSRFAWLISGRNFRLSLGTGQTIVCSPAGAGYEVSLLEANGTATPLSNAPLPLGYAQGVAEDYARRNAQAVFFDKEARWRRYPASEKQIALLERLGLFYCAGITKGEAAQMIDEAMNVPVTDRQRYFIQYHGLHINPAVLTKKEAGVLISQYKNSQTVATA